MVSKSPSSSSTSIKKLTTTKFLIGFMLVICILFFVFRRYLTQTTAFTLLASFDRVIYRMSSSSYTISTPLSLLCKQLDARRSYKRAQELYRPNLTLEVIDRIASKETNTYKCFSENSGKQKVILIVPYRDRQVDLLAFLIHIVPYFRLQGRRIELLIAEQNGNGAFNRAKLFNAAVREIQKSARKRNDRLSDCFCVSLHDVDKLPLNHDVPYHCSTLGPQQLLRISINDQKLKEAYSTFLGGVTMFSMDQLVKMNGASNSFKGWGGEDDDLWRRIHLARMKVVIPRRNLGRFYEGNFNHTRERNPNRRELLRRPNQRWIMLKDGLRQVEYSLERRVNYRNFVWMLLNV